MILGVLPPESANRPPTSVPSRLLDEFHDACAAGVSRRLGGTKVRIRGVRIVIHWRAFSNAVRLMMLSSSDGGSWWAQLARLARCAQGTRSVLRAVRGKRRATSRSGFDLNCCDFSMALVDRLPEIHRRGGHFRTKPCLEYLPQAEVRRRNTRLYRRGCSRDRGHPAVGREAANPGQTREARPATKTRPQNTRVRERGRSRTRRIHDDLSPAPGFPRLPGALDAASANHRARAVWAPFRIDDGRQVGEPIIETNKTPPARGRDLH